MSNKIMQGSASKPVLEDEAYSQMLVDWGQYIDHDISFTPQSSRRSSTSVPNGPDCLSMCENANQCFPIEVPLTTHALFLMQSAMLVHTVLL